MRGRKNLRIGTKRIKFLSRCFFILQNIYRNLPILSPQKFDFAERKVQMNIYGLFKCFLETERITKLNSRVNTLVKTFSWC